MTDTRRRANEGLGCYWRRAAMRRERFDDPVLNNEKFSPLLIAFAKFVRLMQGSCSCESIAPNRSPFSLKEHLGRNAEKSARRRRLNEENGLIDRLERLAKDQGIDGRRTIDAYSSCHDDFFKLLILYRFEGFADLIDPLGSRG